MGEKEEIVFEEMDFTKLSKNFYNIEKERFLNYKPLHKRLSSGFINYHTILNEKTFFRKATEYLTRISYTFFSVITKEKEYSVDFNFQSNSSFCDLLKNFIQIGLQILTQNNIPYQTRVDLITGLIFHENYHKKYTIRDIKERLRIKGKEKYYGQEHVKLFLENLFPTKLHSILHNILEDRRIERLGAEDFPGYSFYFEELRKYCYFLHSEKKFSPSFIEGILLDFIMIKILLPELEEEFYKQIDIYKDNLNNLKNTASISFEGEKRFKDELESILKVIKTVNDHIIKNEETIFSRKWDDILTEVENIYKLIPFNHLENIKNKLDSGNVVFINISETFGAENFNQGDRISIPSELKELLERIVLEEIKSIEKELDTQSISNNIITLDKVITPNKFSKLSEIQLIEEPIKGIDQQIFNKAKKISKNIFNNLGFLDSRYTRLNETFELTEGELDETELYSLSFNNKSIFEDTEEIPYYALDFGILLDESGSMSSRITEAKIATLSLLLGLKDNKHINLFVYGHTANSAYGPDKVQIFKYYNTIERFLKWERLFSAKSRSNNADGFAIERVGEYMKTSKAPSKILCVVSDGQPAASDYGGQLAEEHVRKVVNDLERQGITVIQICMAYIENSPKMFKHYIPYDTNGNFFDNLKKILLTKLHEFANTI